MTTAAPHPRCWRAPRRPAPVPRSAYLYASYPEPEREPGKEPDGRPVHEGVHERVAERRADTLATARVSVAQPLDLVMLNATDEGLAIRLS